MKGPGPGWDEAKRVWEAAQARLAKEQGDADVIAAAAKQRALEDAERRFTAAMAQVRGHISEEFLKPVVDERKRASPTDKPKILVSTTITIEQDAWLRARASALGLSFAAMIRQVVEDAVRADKPLPTSEVLAPPPPRKMAPRRVSVPPPKPDKGAKK